MAKRALNTPTPGSTPVLVLPEEIGTALARNGGSLAVYEDYIPIIARQVELAGFALGQKATLFCGLNITPEEEARINDLAASLGNHLGPEYAVNTRYSPSALGKNAVFEIGRGI
jgi:hypothetical protein